MDSEEFAYPWDKFRTVEHDSKSFDPLFPIRCDKCGTPDIPAEECFRCGELEMRDEAGGLIERVEWTGDTYITFDCPNCGPRRITK